MVRMDSSSFLTGIVLSHADSMEETTTFASLRSTALSTLRRFYPHPFELHAVTVDLGFENLNLGKIEALCKELDVPYTIVPTQIASIVFDQRKEKNPCALCAKMRKGALNEAIRGAGCNKIAYAHHKDDVVETLMLSLIYEGRFHTFAPVTFLDRMNLFLLPFILTF